MLANLFILILLLVSPSAHANEIESFFAADLACHNQLDHLVYLGQAARLGVAVHEEPFDGGNTLALTRVYVRADRNVAKALRDFSYLLGWRTREAPSEATFVSAALTAKGGGRALVIHQKIHAIQIQMYHVGGVQVAVLSTNQVSQVDGIELGNFLGDFALPRTNR